MPESSVVKSVRLPRDLVDRLGTQARAEHRTVNNLITKILTEAMDEPAILGGVAGSLVASPIPDSKDEPA